MLDTALQAAYLGKMVRYLQSNWLPVALCFLVFLVGLPPPVAAQTLPAQIDIVVVAGEGASSPARQRVTQDPAVKIEDDDHRPVAGVSVVFTLPISGPSGEFANGAKTLMVMTDQAGLATAHGLRTNAVPGKLQIYVTASFRGLRARALINQVVEGVQSSQVQIQRPSKSGRAWKWVLGVAIAGGAAAGGYYYYKNHTSSSSPISIGTGAVVFGTP